MRYSDHAYRHSAPSAPGPGFQRPGGGGMLIPFPGANTPAGRLYRRIVPPFRYLEAFQNINRFVEWYRQPDRLSEPWTGSLTCPDVPDPTHWAHMAQDPACFVNQLVGGIVEPWPSATVNIPPGERLWLWWQHGFRYDTHSVYDTPVEGVQPAPQEVPGWVLPLEDYWLDPWPRPWPGARPGPKRAPAWVPESPSRGPGRKPRRRPGRLRANERQAVGRVVISNRSSEPIVKVRLRRPGRNEVEKKGRVQQILAEALRRAMQLTEVDDFVASIYDAIPEDVTASCGATTLQHKMLCIYEHADMIDLEQAALNIILNEIEDRVVALLLGWVPTETIDQAKLKNALGRHRGLTS